MAWAAMKGLPRCSLRDKARALSSRRHAEIRQIVKSEMSE
jgi:hypothetical protein